MFLKTLCFVFVLSHFVLPQSVTWKTVNNNLQQPVQALNVLPDGTILAGSGSSVFVLDSSNIWSAGGDGIASQSPFEISAFGASAVARFVAFNKSKTLFRSTDQGRTWNLSVNGLLNPFIKKIVSSGDTVLALPSSAFYRSTDNGVNWTLARTGMPTSGSSNDLLRLNDGTLFVAVPSGLYRSTDNAAQWNPVNFFNGKNCLALTVSPSGTIFVGADTSVFSSTDFGASWSDLGVGNFLAKKMQYADSSLFLLGQMVYRIQNSTVQPANTGTSGETITDIAAGPEGSLYASSSKGVYLWNKQLKSWELLQTGFGASKITAVTSFLGIDYVAVKGKGIFSSRDKGITWNILTPYPKNVRSIFRTVAYFFVCDSAGLFRSTDNGSTWLSANIIAGKGTTALSILGSTLYVGVPDNGVYASTDSGATWQARNSGIEMQNITSLVNANNHALIAGSAGGLFRKPNNSNSWTSVGSAGSVNTLVSANPGYLFAGGVNGLYRSPDYGSTWDKIGSITGNVLSVSPTVIPSLLCASSSNGTFESKDDGTTWQSQNSTVLTTMVWTGSALLASSSAGVLYGTIAHQLNEQTKWLDVGSLQNWFAGIGSEPEEYRVAVQQDGWSFPGIRPKQDMQASKAMWIGFNDPAAVTASRKKVLQLGPRGFSASDFIPYKFSLVSAFPMPQVTVQSTPSFQHAVSIDEIDSAQKSDRMIRNEVVTSAGLVVKRIIRQFSQQFHDNYLITEYTLTNSNPYSITGAYLYFVYRWGINAETRYVIGNATGWGINTMIDVRGDGQNPPNTFFLGNTDNDIRAIYGWHGKFPSFTAYDNIGGPVFVPFYDKSDTVGRLGAPQFVGVALLHADKSSKDSADDPVQPSTMSYENSDGSAFIPNQSVDSAAMSFRYGLMSKGRDAARHADLVGPSGDPSLGTSGGQSATLGFGPYTLGPGESVRIVLAEAAAGINEATAVETGKKFKAGTITAAEKNAIVYTGRDSLFKTFRRALANYQSGYSIPNPPRPPKSFSVKPLVNAVELKWSLFQENDPQVSGFDIYRSAGKYYSRAEKIYSADQSERMWIDSTGTSGVPYFYYIASIGRNVDNSGTGSTPPGRLESSRYFTQTYDPVSILTRVGTEPAVPEIFSLEQNFPNPFNPVTSIRYSIPVTANVVIKIFDPIGREVMMPVSRVHQSGTYTVQIDAARLSSGVYFYRIEAGNFVRSKKMILLR